MTRKDVIFQLNDLKRDAMSHFTDDGDDDIFRADVEALDAAIEALKEQPAKDIDVPTNRWISVKDRLPEDQEEVLVCTRSKNGIRNIDKGYMAIDRFIHRGCAEVTHWMPLPAPPKGWNMQ